MNENRNQDRFPKQQARQKQPDEWPAQRTAFHLRKAGLDLGGIDDDDLKQVPVLPVGTRLQQGATYVDLMHNPPKEFTARGNDEASPAHAYVPKDRVPYEVWNRLIGEPKPGQE